MTVRIFTADHVREKLASECKKAGGVQKWAKKHWGVNWQSVHHALSGRRDPSEQISVALGFNKVTRWVLDNECNGD